jgi:sugar phosphate isomerase/epimerase
MDLSMTTDYVSYLGNPEPYLGRIAETGFTHIHWCHEWNTTRLYSREDIRQIKTWLENLGLKLLDLHAPHGIESGWGSKIEEERLASVQLILNRIDMTAKLAGGAIVLHLPQKPSNPRDVDAFQTSLRRSLDQLESHSTPVSIKIALKNMENDNFEDLKQLLSAYDPEFLGLCYDSGHGNIGTSGLDNLERLRDRLVPIHIHDNNGIQDQHALPFSGTVDWERLSQIIATSSYAGCVSLETNMRGQDIKESEYLYRAYQAGSALAAMIENAKGRQESLDT